MKCARDQRPVFENRDLRVAIRNQRVSHKRKESRKFNIAIFRSCFYCRVDDTYLIFFCVQRYIVYYSSCRGD